MDYKEPLQVIWDYLCLNKKPEKADCIVGFGNFNTNIARRAAELYQQGYAPKILFTGGLGRNTEGLLPEPEAVRFAKVAMECGVPEEDILIEDQSRNTKENILFTKELLAQHGLTNPHLLGVHQPFMERRITAAMGVYWPEVDFQVTSPQVTIEEYLADAKAGRVGECFHQRHRGGFPADGFICQAGLSAAAAYPGGSLGSIPPAGQSGL